MHTPRTRSAMPPIVALLVVCVALAGCSGVDEGFGDAQRQGTESEQLLPNLAALPAADLRLEQVGDVTLLRFSTTSWNYGRGPLELEAGEVDRSKEKQRVYQNIYLEDGGTVQRSVGHFTWHEDHDHFHFDDYADYRLYPPDARGESNRVGQKASFCIIDTDRIDHRLEGAPKRRVYTGCDNEKQGMSVGWGDTYRYTLEGQHIDVTGLDDGVYVLEIDINPKGLLFEIDSTDNVSTVRIDLNLTSFSASIVDEVPDDDDDPDEGGGGGGPGNGRCPRC